MTGLGAERDRSTNENTALDERIIDLTLQKNMVKQSFSSPGFYFFLSDVYYIN